jgi:hypothetical protein
MSNQYCKITSWIEHHKDHGDAKYAEAISDLCLDSWLKPGKYNGLTFLYQTNKTVRKKFCDKVFTPESRDACDEFKRYIIPDVFHSCEDFQQKDVGNVLGYKYEVKSCDKHKVVFENGMTIEPLLGHNSFESLSPNLKEVIKVFYVTKGEPPESGEPYRVTHRKREKKTRTVGGNAVDCERVVDDKVAPMFSDGSRPIYLHNAFDAFSACIPELERQLAFTDDHIYLNTIQDLLAMQHTFSSTKSGILDYICYILDSLWDEQDTGRSTRLSGICTQLLNIIHDELCKSSPGIDRPAWEIAFHAACGHIFTPDKITAEVFEKMHKTMDAAIAEHNADASKRNILDLYLSKSAANGVLWGVKLFPVIHGKEDLHKAALSRRLLTCATFNTMGEYLSPNDDIKAKIAGIFYHYKKSLQGHPIWAHTNHLTPIMAANIAASTVSENIAEPEKSPAFRDGDLTGSPMEYALRNGFMGGSSNINSESLFE